jgi:hypothetical protein
MKELKESLWIIIPLVIIFLLFFHTLYHKTYHCIEVEYQNICEECVEYQTKTNGRHGKHKRTWQECVEWHQYNCISTYDSCNCK